MQLRALGKCRFRPSGGFVKPKNFLYAPRQPMVALRLDSLAGRETPHLHHVPLASSNVYCLFLSDIGIGRALYNILPFKATVDLLDVANPEQGITLGMFALGVGFAVGTVPAGAIYDISGSYSVAFIINSVFFSIGGGFLMILKSCKPRWRRRRESRHSVHKSQTSCQNIHGRRTSSDSHGVDNQIEIKC
ncbi:hypothetical protein BSL78_14305 [Apostichopus japonicus]|uniref:Uncharacterized protein n=1 Tax=Stichopus japonicus TaxID=307972 RepID=A0A2G8KLC3_STIJA|nr:hypothetical protein BSL78_14305 [Apostichopus japonicus]